MSGGNNVVLVGSILISNMNQSGLGMWLNGQQISFGNPIGAQSSQDQRVNEEKAQNERDQYTSDMNQVAFRGHQVFLTTHNVNTSTAPKTYGCTSQSLCPKFR